MWCDLFWTSLVTLISLAIGSFFSNENGSSRTRKTYGKAIHLSIAKKPPRFHGRKRRLPSSEAGHVGLPAYKIALTYAPRDSLRSSSDSGNLTCFVEMPWNLHWWMVDDDWYNYLLKTGPFRCHFWLPKRAGPAILTEGGKFWYCLMISPADAKLTNAWIPNKHRHLCNDIMPYHAWQHS